MPADPANRKGTREAQSSKLMPQEGPRGGRYASCCPCPRLVEGLLKSDSSSLNKTSRARWKVSDAGRSADFLKVDLHNFLRDPSALSTDKVRIFCALQQKSCASRPEAPEVQGLLSPKDLVDAEGSRSKARVAQPKPNPKA